MSKRAETLKEVADKIKEILSDNEVEIVYSIEDTTMTLAVVSTVEDARKEEGICEFMELPFELHHHLKIIDNEQHSGNN